VVGEVGRIPDPAPVTIAVLPWTLKGVGGLVSFLRPSWRAAIFDAFKSSHEYDVQFANVVYLV
jgi:hypothetical protein